MQVIQFVTIGDTKQILPNKLLSSEQQELLCFSLIFFVLCSFTEPQTSKFINQEQLNVLDIQFFSLTIEELFSSPWHRQLFWYGTCQFLYDRLYH